MGGVMLASGVSRVSGRRSVARAVRSSVLVGGILVVSALLAALVLLPTPAAAVVSPGELVWMQSWDPKGDFEFFDTMDLVRGPGGDVWIGASARADATGSGQRRPVVARYSQAGAKRWGVVLSTTTQWFSCAGIAVDRGGNTAVVGRYIDAKPREKWVITRLSSSGKRLWTRTRMSPVAGALSGSAMSAGVAVDSRGNIYAAGTIERAATGRDVALCKYTPAGVLKWTRYINGFETSSDIGAAVRVDGSDRIFVSGTVGSASDGTDVVLARYSTAGAEVWKRVWDGDGKNDAASDLAVSTAGVAAAGYSESTAGDSRGVVLKAASAMADGAPLLEKITSHVGWDIVWTDVAINASGDVAVGGPAGYGMTSYFAYARFQWAAADAFASFPSSFGSTICSGVWIGPDATVIAVGPWASETTGQDLLLVSDFVATPDWGSILATSNEQTPKALAATTNTIYVAGESCGDIALWRYAR
jgi:hypothetical protein